MTFDLELDDELEADVRALAAELGVEPEVAVRQALKSYLDRRNAVDAAGKRAVERNAPLLERIATDDAGLLRRLGE